MSPDEAEVDVVAWIEGLHNTHRRPAASATTRQQTSNVAMMNNNVAPRPVTLGSRGRAR
jgi:hypothetical protein